MERPLLILDTAADLGLSPGAIRQLAYRARGTLRAAA
jgi:DNA-directed RNA polymerase specialized sigma24 family protein